MEAAIPQPIEPFGQPDGSIGDLNSFFADFVDFPERYGGIGRSPADARVRVLVGGLGAGKSLYLRRMQDYQAQNNAPATFAPEPFRNLSDLSSEDLAVFARRFKGESANTEHWKLLWRRAIMRSTASYLLTANDLRSHVTVPLIAELADYSRQLGQPRHPRRITNEARQVIYDNSSPGSLLSYLRDYRWPDIEAVLADALHNSKPLFLYVDSIDDNYRWAPTLWTQCQRGLFYSVMDLLREDRFAGRLHVVIAIRDVTLGSVRASEHNLRYLDRTHINILGWSRASLEEFVLAKLRRLDSSYFADANDRSPESWLGLGYVQTSRPGSSGEHVLDYLLRHTRLVPRDMVLLGNRLCTAIRRHHRRELTEQVVKAEVALSSREFANSQIAQCSNQVISDLMPAEAVDKDWAHLYLTPNEYQLREVQRRVISAVAGSRQEVISLPDVDRLDEDISSQCEGEVHLSDILWQDSLLGVLDGHTSNFFSLTNMTTTNLPRASSYKYVWNPILFDLVPALRSTLSAPHWPK